MKVYENSFTDDYDYGKIALFCTDCRQTFLIFQSFLFIWELNQEILAKKDSNKFVSRWILGADLKATEELVFFVIFWLFGNLLEKP